MKILLVDDHEPMRDILRRTIEAKTTFEVVGEAGDGRAAIEATAELAPDVIVMDVMMPVMDGIEATHTIKERWPKVVVLAFSAIDDPDSVDAMIAAGASGFVLKGGDADDLLYSLRKASVGDLLRLREQVSEVNKPRL